MKKIMPIIFAGLLALILIPALANASVLIQINDTVDDHANILNLEGPSTIERTGKKVTIDVVDSTMVAAGAANGGATSMTSSTTAVPVTFSHVNMEITTSDPAFSAKTLADGKVGQLLTIHVYNGAQSTTVTPTTSTAFSVLTFNAIDDEVLLLFADATTGWIVMASNSVGITP